MLTRTHLEVVIFYCHKNDPSVTFILQYLDILCTKNQRSNKKVSYETHLIVTSIQSPWHEQAETRRNFHTNYILPNLIRTGRFIKYKQNLFIKEQSIWTKIYFAWRNVSSSCALDNYLTTRLSCCRGRGRICMVKNSLLVQLVMA